MPSPSDALVRQSGLGRTLIFGFPRMETTLRSDPLDSLCAPNLS